MHSQQHLEAGPGLTGLEELVIIYNPTNPTAIDMAKALCADSSGQLSEFGLHATSVPSEPTLAANVELLREQIPRGSNRLPMVASGDGLTSNILHAAMQVGIDRPVAFAPCGNANDIAKMAYGSRGLRRPLDILLHGGQVRDLRPLAVSIMAPGETGESTRQERAFGYFAVGFSAAKAAALNDKDFRAARSQRGPLGRALMESHMVLSGITDAPTFTIEEDGNSRQAIEALFPNGQTMAKYIRFGRLSLLGERAGRIEIPSPRRRSVAYGLARGALGAIERFDQTTSYLFRVVSSGGDEVTFQRDGEVAILEPDSLLWVRQDHATVPIIAGGRQARRSPVPATMRA